MIIRIMHGLPGSGKSNFINDYLSKNGNKLDICVININSFIKYYKAEDFDIFLQKCANSHTQPHKHPDIILIDGLFLTNNQITTLLTGLLPNLKNNKYFNSSDGYDLIIDTWEEDREACIVNKLISEQNEKSLITIRKAEFEKIDSEKIINSIKPLKINYCKLCTHNVYKQPKEKEFFAKNNIFYPKETLYGEDWCEGGTYCNCWGDTFKIQPDEKPEFCELYNILNVFITDKEECEKYYEELIDNEYIVNIESDTRSDYYGGECDYAYYTCDMKNLYNYLLDKKIITLDNLIKNNFSFKKANEMIKIERDKL